MSNRTVNPTAKALIEAKKLIDSPNKWCKHSLQARNKIDGQHQYCMVGAIMAATGYVFGSGKAMSPAYVRAKMYLQLEAGDDTIPFINDYVATHQDIMNLYDKAIQKALVEEMADV